MLDNLDNIFGTPTEEQKKKATSNTKVAPVYNSKSTRLSNLDNIFEATPTKNIAPVEATPVQQKPKKQGLISSIGNKIGNFFDRPEEDITPDFVVDKTLSKEEQAKAIAKNTADLEAKSKEVNSFKGMTKNFFKALPSSFVEGLPLGVGEIFKQIHDMEKYEPEALEYVTGKEVVKSIPKGVGDFGKGVVKGLASVPLTVAGAVAGVTGRDQEIKFNVPVLGEVSNVQARIVDRVLSGDNSAITGITEGVGELMNGLWLYSIVKAPFVSRPTTVAKLTPEQTANLNLSKGKTIGTTPKGAEIKSFREYQKPTIQTPVYTEVNPALMEKLKGQGVDFSKYNPKNPTFFRFKMEPNGQITGEVVQVKPSYYNTVKGKFGESNATKAPESAFEKPIYSKTIKDTDLVQGAKNAKVSVVEATEGITPTRPVTGLETPNAVAYTSSIGSLASAKPSQVRNNLSTLDAELSDLREVGLGARTEQEIIADMNATRDVFNEYAEQNKEVVVQVKNKNDLEVVAIEVLPFDDGKYSYSLNVNTSVSGMSSPFSTDKLFSSREKAIESAKKEMQNWVNNEKRNAGATELKQLNQIENALKEETPTSKISNEVDTTIVETKTEPLVKSNIQENLVAEAKKYNTAQAFIQKVKGGATQYGDYTPELRQNGLDYKNITEMGIDPEQMVTVYRGIDDISGKVKKQINDGDFVTTDFDSALSYTGDAKNVVEMEVKAKYLYNSEPRDFIEEPFYTGAEYVYSTKKSEPLPSDKDLTDIWEKANGKTTTNDKSEIQELKNSINEGKTILRAGTRNGVKLTQDEIDQIARSIENAQAKIGIENMDGYKIQEVSSDTIFKATKNPKPEDLTKEGLKKWKTLVKRGQAKFENGRFSEIKTQKEVVKETIKESPKTIKQIAEETKIKEPNIRRILGVGAKEGTFERVDEGVYILKKDNQDIAYIHTGDAVSTLPKLAKDGLKADMVFLDIPYDTPAVKGGGANAGKGGQVGGGVEYELLSVADFGKVLDAVKEIARKDNTPVIHMFSQAPSGMKAMTKYNDLFLEKGFIPVGKGEYQKFYDNGKPVGRPTGSGYQVAKPEGILVFTKSGKLDKDLKDLNFKLVRPKGYSTEKHKDMLKAMIEMTTNEGDVVLDPFAGSGVTGAEAIKSGRKAVLIEKNPQVVEEIIKPRVKKAIIETDAIEQEIKPINGEVLLGETDAGLLTTKELEAKGEEIKELKKNIKKEQKAFVEAQNGLYLEPSKTTGKTIEVAGEKIEVSKLPKPILTRTAMVGLLKNSPEFKANPELVVVEKDGKTLLAFNGEKQKFSLRPLALGLVEKNLTIGTVIKLNPETFKLAGTDTFRVNEYKGGAKQSGSFASMDKFRETMEPVERAIDAVNPIDFPELVKLARQLTGDFPKVKLPRFRPSMGGYPNGLFTPTGNGKITLNPNLFVEGNEQQAAKTLAHEIGHLIDYLPDQTMARGNILGRLATLHKFRKDFLEDAGVTRTNTEMARELWALSKYWRPVDEATAPASFLAYRKEPAEMYADFISALFNDPKLVQNMAPESYNTFFKLLDRKPEVKVAYFELQELLAGTSEDLMKARQEDIRAGFARGEDLQAGFQAKKEARVTKFWERLRQQLDDVNYPITKKQQMAEANGRIFSDEENPRFLLQEQSLVDNENFLLVDKIDNEIVKPLEKSGMIIEDVGEYLLLDRIINERQNIANPFGFNTKNAPKQMDFLKKTVGEKNFELLKEKVKMFHDLVYQSVEEAVRVGSYNKELFETKIKPNKDFYASFQVVDYMQDYIPATVKGQTGTLKEVANPFVSTILKTIALNRLNAYQRAKNATISMLKENFKDEITPSKRITSDGKLTIFKVGRDKGGLEVLEDGKMTSYDVDPYIAESFKRDKVGDLNMLVSLVDKFNNKLFKPLVTTYNLGFALAFNPIRDFKRNYKLIPNATVGQLLTQYVKSLPEAVKYNKGQLTEFTQSLVESKAINAPVNDYNYDPARDDELGNILKKYGLIKEDVALENKYLEVARKKILRPVAQVLEGIRFMANTFEIVSKIAGAKVRIAGGESGKQLAENVRNFTGTPNFKVRGKNTGTTNAIFVFSNIMKEGLKSDYRIATNPKTRSGYWWKTVKIDLMPKFLMFLAGAGVLGAGIKEYFDKISEYDKSNYLILPLGVNEDGKAVYARIPHDETGRLLSSAFWKMANFMKDGKGSELQDIFAIGAGQLPSVSPIISVLGNWTQYLSGRNPYDSFRGRNLIDDTTWTAGGGAALKKMIQWTTNNLGFTKFATYDTSKNTGVETFMQVAPFFSSVIKISDYGQQEQLKNVTAEVKKEKAKQTLIERDVIKKYVKLAEEEGKLTIFNATIYGNKAVKEILGHMPQSKDEQDHADRIQQKFKVSTKRQLANDPRYINLIDASSKDEKKAILKTIKEDSTAEEYAKIKNDLLQLKIVTPEILYSVK